MKISGFLRDLAIAVAIMAPLVGAIVWLASIPERRRDEKRQERAAQDVSRAAEAISQLPAALERIEKVLSRSPGATLVSGRTDITINIGTVNIYRDGLPESKSPELARLIESAASALETQDWAKGSEQLAKAEEKAETLAQRAAILNMLALSHYRTGQLSQALLSFQEGLKAATGAGDRTGEAAIVGNMGSVYLSQGKYDLALEHYQRALEIDRQIGHRQGEARNLHNIGVLHKARGETAMARDFLRQALTIFEQLGAAADAEKTRGILRELEGPTGE